MKRTTKSATVHFSAKGQVLIPRWLRKEFDIEEGTRASVLPTPQGILVTPLTPKRIRSLRGSLKGSKALGVLQNERKREREL